MDNDRTTFADWVSATAKGLGYRTDAQLAAAIGVQQSTVTRWRQGNQPQMKHLVALAYLFKMRIDPLLAMSGHVPADLLGDAGPAGPPMTESVRRIRDSSLGDFQKEALTSYWDQRLGEERRKLHSIISYLEQSEGVPRPAVGDELLRVVRMGVHTDAVDHLAELVLTVMAIEAAPRKRRRRGSRQDELTVDELSVGYEGSVAIDGAEDRPETKGRLELEP